MDSKNLRDTFNRYLTNFLAKTEATATAYDRYLALAYAVRSELMKNWIATTRGYREKNVRRAYYLSTEYIFGKSLRQNLLNLDIDGEMSNAVKMLGVSLEELCSQEDDFMLGNGSEGMLAASLLEAFATQGYPVQAYGIRYDYTQFRQDLRGGQQIERPNDWLRRGNPWEIGRPEYSCAVRFGGECRMTKAGEPLGPWEWKNTEIVHAIPYDIPVVGYRNGIVNTLRLWSARASEEFMPDYLNHGDYERACEDKSKFSRITQILFPDEDVRRATDLRMKQQYFFISASLQDIIRRFKFENNDIQNLDTKITIHLGGSRCALAIPELMRILVDEEKVPWPRAWELTRSVFSYTSHATVRDDTEIWPVYKIGQILPRQLQIIFDVNQLHLEQVRKKYGQYSSYVPELSLVEEGEVKRIRFADMAVLGSSSVNGVSREQTALLAKKVFPTFAAYSPERFTCKVSGIGARRWLLNINRPLSQLISRLIGDNWIKNPAALSGLEQYAGDEQVLDELTSVKKNAKIRLANHLRDALGKTLDESMMFDVQLGRVHTSKRQLLHVLYLLHCYLSAKAGVPVPTRRLHIFAGKASPADFLGKQIIHLIAAAADRINSDPQTNSAIRAVFIPDFSMSWAECIVPAVDLSEQLSTSTLEPSGTFNLKCALNGAVAIASRGGTNVEMAERIGKEHMAIFGKSCDELFALRDYRPGQQLAKDARIRAIFSFLENDLIPHAPEGHSLYPLLSNLRDIDAQFVLLDFDDYLLKQGSIDALYAGKTSWTNAALLACARAGWLSSDRLAHEYAQEQWKVKPA